MNHSKRHAEALANVFSLTPGNSDREKYVFWAVLVLWTIAGFGLVTDTFVPDETLWQLLTSAILLQGGRIWGKESERLRK